MPGKTLNPNEVGEHTDFDSDALIVKGLDHFQMPEPTADPNEEVPTGPAAGPPPVPAPPDPSLGAPTGPGPTATGPTGLPAPTGEPKDFRFASHEEAEKGYKNQQRYVTELEAEKIALEEQLTEKEKAVQAKERAKKEGESRKEFIKDRTKEKMKALEALDGSEDDYLDQVAEIEAQAVEDIRSWEYTPEDPPAPPESEITAAPTRPGSAPPSVSDGDNADKAALDYIKESMSSAGIEHNNETFVHFSKQAPLVSETGRKLSFDEQINWAIDKTREHLAVSKAEGSPEIDENDPVFKHYIANTPVEDKDGKPIPIADQADWAISETKKYHSDNRQKVLHGTTAPMGKGGHIPPPGSSAPADEKPVTLDSALEADMARRRI